MTHNSNMIKNPLLSEQIFSLDAKCIKRIIIGQNCNIDITRTEDFGFNITSNKSISCKIETSTLYINNFNENIHWYLCCAQFFKLKEIYSNDWKINATFIVGEIIVDNASSLKMNDGFDKNLSCTKFGNYGKMALNNLYLTKLNCDVFGSSSIICVNSNCSEFTGHVNNLGKITTPTIQNFARLKISNFGQIDCTVTNNCDVIEENKKFGKINKKIVTIK